MARRFLSVSMGRRATFQLSLLIVISARASGVAGMAIIDSTLESLRVGAAPGPVSAFASGFGSGAFLTSFDAGVESVVARAGFSTLGLAASGAGSELARRSFFVFSLEVSGTGSVAAASTGAFDPVGRRFCSPAAETEGAGFDPLDAMAWAVESAEGGS